MKKLKDLPRLETVYLLEQMFCEEEGILAKFNEVNITTIKVWLEEKGVEI